MAHKESKPVSAVGARLKAGREAAARKREEEREALLKRVEELEAKMANTDTLPAVIEDTAAALAARARTVTDTPSGAAAADIAKRKEKPNEQRDELDWITHDTPAVYIVAKNMTVTLRPSNTRVYPPIENISVNSIAMGPWAAMPFDTRSRARKSDERAAEEKLNEIMYGNWGHFVITREIAQDVYADPRNPIPTKAVICAEDFRGYDRITNRAIGVERDLGPNPVPLREVVRKLLQRMVAFVDIGHHIQPVVEKKLSAARPNPYRGTLANLAQKLPAVSTEGATHA